MSVLRYPQYEMRQQPLSPWRGARSWLLTCSRGSGGRISAECWLEHANTSLYVVGTATERCQWRHGDLQHALSACTLATWCGGVTRDRGIRCPPTQQAPTTSTPAAAAAARAALAAARAAPAATRAAQAARHTIAKLGHASTRRSMPRQAAGNALSGAYRSTPRQAARNAASHASAAFDAAVASDGIAVEVPGVCTPHDTERVTLLPTPCSPMSTAMLSGSSPMTVVMLDFQCTVR